MLPGSSLELEASLSLLNERTLETLPAVEIALSARAIIVILQGLNQFIIIKKEKKPEQTHQFS